MRLVVGRELLTEAGRAELPVLCRLCEALRRKIPVCSPPGPWWRLCWTPYIATGVNAGSVLIH